MKDERNTFVLTLDDDVAEFLDVKNKSASELNTYINQVIQQEKNRRQSQLAAKTPPEVM